MKKGVIARYWRCVSDFEKRTAVELVEEIDTIKIDQMLDEPSGADRKTDGRQREKGWVGERIDKIRIRKPNRNKATACSVLWIRC